MPITLECDARPGIATSQTLLARLACHSVTGNQVSCLAFVNPGSEFMKNGRREHSIVRLAVLVRPRAIHLIAEDPVDGH
jgi:hypothetical protein